MFFPTLQVLLCCFLHSLTAFQILSSPEMRTSGHNLPHWGSRIQHAPHYTSRLRPRKIIPLSCPRLLPGKWQLESDHGSKGSLAANAVTMCWSRCADCVHFYPLMSLSSKSPFGMFCKKALCAVKIPHKDAVRCIHGPYLLSIGCINWH